MALLTAGLSIGSVLYIPECSNMACCLHSHGNTGLSSVALLHLENSPPGSTQAELPRDAVPLGPSGLQSGTFH